MSGSASKSSGNTRDHEFDDELDTAPPVQDRLGIQDIMEVCVEVSADLGQCNVQVRDILELKQGTVLPLNKLAGEMADVYINGIPFAKGEVVVLVDSLHVRLAEITGATDKDLAHG